MLKRAGSKSISVDGQQFRYVISGAAPRADGRVPLSVTVQHCHGNGSRLRITGLMGDRVPEQESKFYMGRTLKRPVTPKDVEQLVRAAVSSGWQPHVSGKPFVLRTELVRLALDAGIGPGAGGAVPQASDGE